MLPKNSDLSTVTVQTRVAPNQERDPILGLFAELMGRAERSLFADVRRGRSPNECKSSYIKLFGMTARHFNSIRVRLEGTISSAKEVQKNNLQNLKLRIASLERLLKKKASKLSPKASYQKKQRLTRLEAKKKRLEEDIAQNRVRICFGTKKLFRAQYHLEANGYHSHEAWKEDWKASRSNQIFLNRNGRAQLC